MFTGEWPTLVELFDITCKRFPHRPCFRQFIPEDWTLDFTQAHDHIIGIANYILAQGTKKGDKIAVSGKNSCEWALAYLGAIYAGCVIVPLDAALKLPEMEHFMEFAGVKGAFLDNDKLQKLSAEGGSRLSFALGLDKVSGDAYLLDHEIAGPLSEDAPKAISGDVAAILFTSGTTGIPKGVQLTHENIVSDTFLAECYMPVDAYDVWYAILPIHHAYTMVAVFMEGIATGAEVVFGKRLAINQLFKELRDGKVTMFLAVPMLFNKLLSGLMEGIKKKSIIAYGLIRFGMGFSGFVKKLTGKNIGRKLFGGLLRNIALESNRICICGGGPLPASTFKMYNQLGIDFVQGYGLTEASPITHLNPVDAYKETSVGKLFPTLEQKIVDPDEDGNGLLYIKGSVVMKGYYNNPEATAEVLAEDGWLNTGDVGHLDDEGYLYLTGRKRNIIVTEGGKNVFPEEVEDHFQLYNEIEQICVCSYVKDKDMKIEGIRAIVYPSEALRNKYAEGKVLQTKVQTVIDQVNKGLPSYEKIEKLVISMQPLPETSTKKVKRFEVAKIFEDQ
jgi:long-chain acyl-CoA synthetase